MTEAGLSVTQARESRDAYVRKQLSLGTLKGIGNALHSIQDELAEGHQFKEYSGLQGVDVEHLKNDFNPRASVFGSAYDRSLDLLRKLKDTDVICE
jgi:hypothetical protein